MLPKLGFKTTESGEGQPPLHCLQSVLCRLASSVSHGRRRCTATTARIQHILCTEFQFLFSRQHTQCIEPSVKRVPLFSEFSPPRIITTRPRVRVPHTSKSFSAPFLSTNPHLVGHHIQKNELAGVAAPHPPSSPTTYNRIPLLSSATRCARAAAACKHHQLCAACWRARRWWV